MNPTQLLPSGLNPNATPETDPAAQGKQRITIVETIEWLDRLITNADFVRYLEFVKSGAREFRAQGQSLALDMEKRDAWSQRHFIVLSMTEWPEDQLAAAKNQLKALDEKQKPIS